MTCISGNLNFTEKSIHYLRAVREEAQDAISHVFQDLTYMLNNYVT